jgi:hypothetical protein
MSITIEQLMKELAALRARVDALESASGLFAADSDLDSRRGDPTIRFDPKRWRGERHKGRTMSRCDPSFLDEYAEALAYFASHPKPDKDPKYAKFDQIDAGRARSWARRLRAGGGAAAPVESTDRRPDDSGFDAPAFDSPAFPDEHFGNETPADEWDLLP